MTIITTAKGIETYTEYNADYIRKVKQIGGKWDGEKKAWIVPLDNEEILIALLKECYGYTPADETGEVVKIKYRPYDFEGRDGIIKIGSITTARRRSRDADVTVYENSAVVAGNFRWSAGSMRNPVVAADEDVVMTSIISKAVYDALEDYEKENIEVLEEKTDLQKLLEKRESLLKQLAEIEEQIKKAEA